MNENNFGFMSYTFDPKNLTKEKVVNYILFTHIYIIYNDDDL